MKTSVAVLVFFLAVLGVSTTHADIFGSGSNSFEIEFVTIGDPGNVADTTGHPNPAGSVPYVYRIGKFEISEGMINKANSLSAAEGMPLSIAHDNRGTDKPVTDVDWFEATRFVNWLNTSSGSHLAYKYDENGNFQLWEPGDPGYDPNNLFRNKLARYFLPGADEWYKAAYYNPSGGDYFNFATGSNTAPTSVVSGTALGTAVYDLPSLSSGPADVMLTGGLSPYGTMGQDGNVAEMEETEFDLTNDSTILPSFRGVRGAGYTASANGMGVLNRYGTSLGNYSSLLGFRVASIIPEPSTWTLLVLGSSGIVSTRLWRRRQ